MGVSEELCCSAAFIFIHEPIDKTSVLRISEDAEWEKWELGFTDTFSSTVDEGKLLPGSAVEECCLILRIESLESDTLRHTVTPEP